MFVGLFRGYTGLFWGYTGLFWGNTGLFWGYVGLFGGRGNDEQVSWNEIHVCRALLGGYTGFF